MLLEQLKTQTQQGIQDIQDQIERLHEEQKQLQAYYQQLGSVETAMESAVKQVQTAIALVRKVCPDELENFRNTLNAQFNTAPIAELPEASEPDPVEEEPIEPQPESEDSGDGGAISIEIGEVEEEFTEVTQQPEEESDLATEKSIPQSVGAAAFDLDSLSMKELQDWCGEKGLTKAAVKEYGPLTRKSTWIAAYRNN